MMLTIFEDGSRYVVPSFDCTSSASFLLTAPALMDELTTFAGSLVGGSE